jgi:APA family basic amino acid/polyamine antiporter
MNQALDRRLGLAGSVAVGMSAMIGAGLFVAFAPAASAAGDDLLLALVIAALVAACNAVSSARLARRYPVAGGTYVYGRERLGPFWGYLAGWSFVAGKLSSCAAMAFALGGYLWPEQARLVAVVTVAAVTVVNLAGVEKSAGVGIVLVGLVLAAVAVAVILMLGGPAASDVARPTTGRGVLEAAGLLFFAFAGYARLATLGEEVRQPERTIPRAIAIAVVLVVTIYAAAAIALLHVLGADRLSRSSRPFVAGLDAAGAHGFTPVAIAAATLAAGGALLSLTLGVSRTTFAMARDSHLPKPLASVSARTKVPHVAEVAVGVVVCLLLLVGDLATSVAFSSFCVLVYYAIANASAWTLSRSALPRTIPALGGIGCLALALSLSPSTIMSGGIVVALGAVIYAVRRRLRQG